MKSSLLAAALLLAPVLAVRSQEEEAPERPVLTEAVPAPAPAPEAAPAPKEGAPVIAPPVEDVMPEPKVEIGDPAPPPPPPPPPPAPKPSLRRSAEPKPAKAAPVPPPPPAPPAPPAGPSQAEELSFLSRGADDDSSETVEALIAEAEAFLARHPEGPQAFSARQILAATRARKGDAEAAAVDWLLFIHEAPDAPEVFGAKRNFTELVEKKVSRKFRGPLNELVRPADLPSASERLAKLLETPIDAAGDPLHDPIEREIRRFQARFPDFAGDRVQSWLAKLAEKSDKQRAALFAWRRLLALYPASELRPAAWWAAGDILADHLKEYNKAIDAYQELVSRHPADARVLPAMEKTAKLFEERLKSYDLAVDVHERIIKAFPKTDGALKAFQAAARLQKEKLSKPAEAIAVYKRMAAHFRHPAAFEGLRAAAGIARKDLKDYKLEVELRQKAAADYPDAKETPEELFTAAEVLESDIKDLAAAKEAYQKVADQFPAHKLAKKAAERVGRL